MNLNIKNLVDEKWWGENDTETTFTFTHTPREEDVYNSHLLDLEFAIHADEIFPDGNLDALFLMGAGKGGKGQLTNVLEFHQKKLHNSILFYFSKIEILFTPMCFLNQFSSSVPGRWEIYSFTSGLPKYTPGEIQQNRHT